MIKVNNSKIFSNQIGINISTSVAVLILSLNTPSYAGPQSLLDPYNNVQPPTTQPNTKALGDRTSKKAPRAANTNTSSNPGFMSGVKEIQHGYVATFKAAGHGIINGIKSAGATIVAGGGKIKDGISAAGHKISPGQKVAKAPKAKKNQTAIVSNGFAPPPSISSSATNMPPLPGKPLGGVVNTVPHTAKVKPAKMTTVGQKNKNIVARTFDKLNIFSKHKQTNPDLAANSQPR